MGHETTNRYNYLYMFVLFCLIDLFPCIMKRIKKIFYVNRMLHKSTTSFSVFCNLSNNMGNQERLTLLPLLEHISFFLNKKTTFIYAYIMNVIV